MQPKNYQCELAHSFVVHNFVDYKMTVYQMNYLKALDAGIHTGFQSSAILEEYRLGFHPLYRNPGRHGCFFCNFSLGLE